MITKRPGRKIGQQSQTLKNFKIKFIHFKIDYKINDLKRRNNLREDLCASINTSSMR